MGKIGDNIVFPNALAIVPVFDSGGYQVILNNSRTAFKPDIYPHGTIKGIVVDFGIGRLVKVDAHIIAVQNDIISYNAAGMLGRQLFISGKLDSRTPRPRKARPGSLPGYGTLRQPNCSRRQHHENCLLQRRHS